MSWERERATIRRDAGGIVAYATAFGMSYGAVSVTSGLSVAQTCVLSMVMFTGASQFAFIGVVGGGGSALGGSAIGEPEVLGLDAAVPAAFLALLWPRLDDTTARVVAVGGAAVATLLIPLVPAGVPVLAAAPVAVVAGLRGRAVRETS